MDRILKASYGDPQQRQANLEAKQPHANAAQVEQAWRERRAANPRAELPTPPAGNGPFLWDPKNQGSAYGLYNAQREPRRGVKVEIRPGVFHEVDEPRGRAPAMGAAGASPGGGAAGGGARRGRPTSAPPGARGAGGPSPGRASPGPPPRAVVEMLPEVAALEERMRGALRRAAAVHIKERTVLLQAFAAVLGKRHVELGPRDKVTPDQFAAVWRRFGISLSSAHCAAFFDKYGRDARGCMPVLNFSDALVMGASRLDMAANDTVQRGAYVAGQPATHMGKILYPEAKKGVWPPSNWDPRLAERSAQLPDVRLSLEFVHGYDGHLATSPNIFYTASGEVVYNAAGLGVVYDKASHSQRFFLGHDDDVLCLALHPLDRTTAATGQLGAQPCVLVWDSVSCKQLARINVDPFYRGVQALAFSPDGTRLAAITTDNSHSLHVWDWMRRTPLCEPRKSQPGAPPAVYGVMWSRFEPERLVTYGQNHIKFWKVPPDPRAGGGALAPVSEAGVYALGKTHTITAACFLRSGIVLSGNEAGCIGSWKGVRLMHETQAHAPGPPTRRPDGTPTFGGVRCLVLQNERTLLSGGADGVVRVWDVSGGDLGPMLKQFPMLMPNQVGTQAPPAVRGLDCAPDNPEMFVAGVASCDVWEVDKDPEVLVYGQQADLYGLATNPAFPHVYATCCDSDKVTVWSSATRKPVRIVSMGGLVARSCAFSPDGQQLAVGCGNGGVKVLEFHPTVRQVWWGKTFGSSVDELKYSPCGRFLAAGSHDQFIDIFDVSRAYARVCRCVGHSSTVRHLDWAADSSAIQSIDQAYEILYFDPRTGKQLKANQRDTLWAGWSCLLGFPVMGIWFPDSDGTDINSVHASPSGRYVLTADDLGRVRLLNFPCVVQGAPAHVYRGHCSHVMNVRWGSDETYAVSVGGKDRCVFQWRVVRQAPKQPQQMYVPWAQVDDKGLVWAEPPQQHQRAAAAAARGSPGPLAPPGGTPGRGGAAGQAAAGQQRAGSARRR
ncbi:hypothetical protein HYH03_013944 [Edaphochlamys debaryana]|uniref:HELP domain-containing protein n=1 Tax=Edaphochlamys debaryana TaxID=47281 RepID=A0A836BU00_9CHLO|nr:hypothetical protein HYH03_013944 [Edaphochlamys debaryana]|eukprot:KAG2487374.1 hypothetical protein HYH03_013944 [Edaphochlamys debaryana]